VQGKPLFLWSLEERIDEVEIPLRESEIYELELLESGSPTSELSISELRDIVHSKINSIKSVPKDVESKRIGADFRREKVLKSWTNFFNKWSEGASDHKFEVVKLRCRCSSGTYMRTLAKKVGNELGTPALALSIVRTEVVM